MAAERRRGVESSEGFRPDLLLLPFFAVEVLEDGFNDQVVDGAIESLGQAFESLDRLPIEFALRNVDRQSCDFTLADHLDHLPLAPIGP